MSDAAYIGEDLRTDLVKRRDHQRWRPDAGDHHPDSVPQQQFKIFIKPRLFDDEVGADRRRLLFDQRLAYLAESFIEFRFAAACRSRKSTNRASLAHSDDQFRP
jgi:hypothetical protein